MLPSIGGSRSPTQTSTPRPWGGFEYRGLKFPAEVDELIQALLWRLVRLHPHYRVRDYTNALSDVTGIHFKRNFVLRIFKNWRWSWKKPAVQHVQKYTRENIAYYARWVILKPHIPFAQLKFCDKSHFVSRQLHRDSSVSPIGVRPYLHDAADLAESFSLTLLLDLSNEANPFFVDLRAGSNTEFDFLAFVRAAVAAGRLQDGDFLIVDNATVHFGEGSRDELLQLLMDNGIQYLFLPTDSPELNPCELGERADGSSPSPSNFQFTHGITVQLAVAVQLAIAIAIAVQLARCFAF